ncbi:MAG: restriction endonuclease subunit S [Candidatus Aenigmatarchaeota archaeon]
MSVVSVVKSCGLEGARRLDAEYYQPKYLFLIEKLNSINAVPVKKVAIPVKRRFVPKEDEYFNYIEISDVDLLTGEFSTSRIVGAEAPDRAQWIVRKNDVLISTVRPARNAVVLIRKESDNLVASSGFCILQSQKVTPEYLFLYFKTEFVKSLLDRHTTATEYPAVTWKDVLNIPIYMPDNSFQETISAKVKNAFRLLEQSREFYLQAEALLLSELGLKDFKPVGKLSYKVNLSKVSTVYRMDAEYFNPKYDEIIERISKKTELKPLRNFILSVKKGIEVGSESYQDEGVPFIRVSNLSVSGLVSKDQKFISEELYEVLENEFKPVKGEILLTKDATPGIAYFVKEQIRGIVSSGILRIRVKNINPEYLCLCINSTVGKSQVERDVGGSVILHWKLGQVKNLMIPILPELAQQKIAKLVYESYRTREKGKQLLKEAKEEIEKIVFSK